MTEAEADADLLAEADDVTGTFEELVRQRHSLLRQLHQAEVERDTLRAGLNVEHEIQRLLLERLNIPWTPGEPFVALVEDAINRLRHTQVAAFDVSFKAHYAEILKQRDELLIDNDGLRETIAEWQAIHGTFSGDVHAACQAEIERIRIGSPW